MPSDNDLIRRQVALAWVKDAGGPVAADIIHNINTARITYEDALQSAELPGEWKAVNDWRQERRYSDKVHGVAERRSCGKSGFWFWLVWQSGNSVHVLAHPVEEPPTLADAQAACDAAALEHLPMSVLLPRRGEE